ncbi:hypothetical protein F0562_013369 [Nyssa sinensis]|uniref:Uncharacterized protein n=1 Tax=Nyssa sinensis TaxID=561372 RepID=A0A5J4ZK25_9ASTE|nr:hypothetical protein F0562_013369 [Nyssa sinensis]
MRGRKSLNNGSYRGHGGGERGAWVGRGIQAQKQSFNSFDKVAFLDLRSAYVSHSKGLLADSKCAHLNQVICDNTKLPIKATHGVSPMDKASIQGGDGRSSQGIKESRNSAPEAYSSLALCGHERLPLKVQNGEYPLGNSEIHGGDWSLSQEEQKVKGMKLPSFSAQPYASNRGCLLKFKIVNTPWVIVRFMEVMRDLLKKSKKVKLMEFPIFPPSYMRQNGVVVTGSKFGLEFFYLVMAYDTLLVNQYTHSHAQEA